MTSSKPNIAFYTRVRVEEKRDDWGIKPQTEALTVVPWESWLMEAIRRTLFCIMPGHKHIGKTADDIVVIYTTEFGDKLKQNSPSQSSRIPKTLSLFQKPRVSAGAASVGQTVVTLTAAHCERAAKAGHQVAVGDCDCLRVDWASGTQLRKLQQPARRNKTWVAASKLVDNHNGESAELIFATY